MIRLMKAVFSKLTTEELALFKELDTPRKVQDFLDMLPVNHEPNGDTCKSPRFVLKEKNCHCIEGAMLSAAILYFHGHEPLLMDLKATSSDFDHVVALFREGKTWGAISKTNHPVLRWREPIYSSPRELAMSYFHEYFLDDGKKTLRSFSKPFNLKQFDKKDWIIDPKNMWHLATLLDESPHIEILSRSQIQRLRLADKIEIKATTLREWHNGKKKI